MHARTHACATLDRLISTPSTPSFFPDPQFCTQTAEAHRRALEALELERSKAQKREERIAARLEAHLKGTAQGFELETGTRIGM